MEISVYVEIYREKCTFWEMGQILCGFSTAFKDDCHETYG